MYILSVDTTAKTAAVCLAKEDELLGLVPVSRLVLNSTVTHSESLLPMIGQALSLANVPLSSVDAFVITSGPGSFTGVRIGVSTVKGLAFSQGENAVCIPVSTLYSLALNLCAYGDNVVVCPVMDARREQFYNALFSLKSKRAKRLCEDRVITAKELVAELCEKYPKRKIVLCGDGAALFYNLYKKYPGSEDLKISPALPGDLLQDAFSVARAGYEILKQESFDASQYGGSALSPTYLRLSQAERERNERLLNENK
ncbi:MAG: tRNA (adenosine(37)-N6)-threonylcarbamoyltransferase complex dimerization subunit type 1 TsaB [Clostridia bacterium]|nr:tRNA (adenosine(37)-N6)-threonylcarbamoyltransferase complex dimerization subunit type 1 TsaB [Clostridia bacterium]